MIDVLASNVLDWLYPPRCMACGKLLPMEPATSSADMSALGATKWFCVECWPLLAWIQSPICEKCGRPVETGQAACPECSGKTFHFVRNYSLFIYDDILKDIIHKFKYHGHPGYGRGLGTLLARKLDSRIFLGIDYIVPVPMHKTKIKQRGYNQATILAKAVSTHCGLPLRTDLLLRAKDTKPQSSLSMRARENNIKDAFVVAKKNQITAKKIMVIDDIYTTGSTMSACSRALMLNGADKVFGVTLSAAVRDLDNFLATRS